MSDEPENVRAITITRLIDAPAHLVFAAHADPVHVKRWFGPVGWPLSTCEMDFRVGGRFHFQMTSDAGELGPPFGGTYLEIVPNLRIRYDNSFEAPGSPVMVTTLSFDEDAEGRTLLTHHTVFESQAVHDEYRGLGFEEGTGSSLDLLADEVREMVAEMGGG
ncbi:polyketide cyclase [Sphingobium lactosutens]|uniref:SRPBCC domain-containing protein n=1 Tax=Sphingobium lactosutens TaxID=522773 RepID=UPI0015BE6651|nr:SRPBCC domain-containing protein [Sphingobium lactosutens]NWK95078.1 polyketide cyclase [Sphingobium lactosutens]